MKKISIIYTAVLSMLSGIAVAQQESVPINIPVSLNQYLVNVSKGNLDYIAKQLDVSIAEASLKAAHVFPDPQISLGYTNNQDQTMKLGQSIETGISYPVSLGNKRGANIALANSQYELSQLVLDEYFRNLRADAAISYFSALKLQKTYQLQEETYEQMLQLAQADSIRLKDGEANNVDALQSALEAKAQLNQVFQAKADMQNAFFDFSRLQGKAGTDTVYNPVGEFPASTRDFNLTALVDTAVKNKGDIKIAIKNKEISEKNLRLLQANRAFEFSLEAGYSYNSVAKNNVAPSPAYSSYNAGISIPLKFSNTNRQAMVAAKLAIDQSEIEYNDIRQQLTTSVIQAYNTFVAQRKQLEHYNEGLIGNAEKILNSRVYSYQRGESNLVEVISARRTYVDLRSDYLETLYRYVSSLIELERVAGIWDLDKM